MECTSMRVNLSVSEFGQLLQLIARFPFVVIDKHERIIACNDMYEHLAGVRAADIQGLPIGRFHKLTPPAEVLIRRGHQTREQEQSQPVLFITEGEKLTPIPCQAIPLICEDGDYYGIVLKHRSAPDSGGETLLQPFADAFMRDVNLGVILVNTDFKLVAINEMACHVLGVTREDVLNRPMEEVFAAVPNEHRLVQRSILDGVVIRNHAVSWMNNQERYELLMDSNLLRDHQGNLVGAYIIFKDVTNLRSLEEQVQRSDRLAMIGQIAAGTAHEIRNPLTSIRGFMQVLRKTFQEKGMEKEHGYTEIMLTEIDRINDLVNEFLLLSKPKNISLEQLDLSAVLREILPIINNEAILHDVSVQYRAEMNLPKIVADRELLKQVFLNICKNGIEAMAEGGALTITEKWEREDNKISVDIHDSGPGIPPFLIDKIFDPFFTTKEKGTGLGLSVCQRIIHDIGGTIRVSAKGFGTTFTVSIPFRTHD